MVLWAFLLFSLIGVLAFVLIIRYIVITGRCSKWPVVVGKVISSEMKLHKKAPKIFAQLAEVAAMQAEVYSQEAAPMKAGVYRPDVIYEYEINGNKYTNNKVRPVGKNQGFQKREIDRILNLYPVGAKVYIYYNPKNPSISFTDPWIRFSPVAITIPTALIFLGLGLCFSEINLLFYWGINLISYALYIAAVLIIAQNIRSLVIQRRSKKWPYADGKIIKIMVYARGSGSSGRGRGGTSYNVDVTYTYNVEGQNYTNHRIKLSFTHGVRTYVPKIFAMMKVEKYEENKNVRVFYDPKNPNESILEHGFDWFLFIMMFIFALSFIFIGWFVI